MITSWNKVLLRLNRCRQCRWDEALRIRLRYRGLQGEPCNDACVLCTLSKIAWLVPEILSQDSTLEGGIPLNRMHLFKKSQDGLVYTIERFDIFKARERYRAVDHPCRISLTQRTISKPAVSQPGNFLMFAYYVFPFSEHPCRISFTQRTIVKSIVPQPGNFPMFSYSVFPFSELENTSMSGYTMQLLLCHSSSKQ